MTVLVSLPSLFIDDSFLSYDDSLSSDSFDTSSDSSSSALSSSPYKLSLSSSSFINSSLSLYAGGGIKSAKTAFASTAGGTSSTTNIYEFSPIGVMEGDDVSTGDVTEDTSNSETTGTGLITYSGGRSTNYTLSKGTTWYHVTIYGSLTVGATSGSSDSSWLGGADSYGGSGATKGYTFLSESVANSFAANLKTAVNKSSSNYFYDERNSKTFYYINSVSVGSNTSAGTYYIPYTSGSTFSGGYTTTYSTFQQEFFEINKINVKLFNFILLYTIII